MNTRTIIHRLLLYAFSDKRMVAITLLLLGVATVAGVAGPYLIKIFIDDHLVPGNWDTSAILVLGALYIAANILAAFLGYQETLRLNQLAQAVVLRLRKNIFSHLLKMPLRRFDHVPVGALISRVTNDTEAVKDLFVGVLGVYLKNTIRILGIFIIMALMNWQLMLICLLFLPVVIGVMVLYRHLSTPIFHKARELLAQINASLNESIQGVRVVQLFNQEQRFAQRFSALSNDHFIARMRTMQMDALLLRPMVDFLYVLTLAGLLYFFGLNHHNLGIEVGVLYAFLNYLGQFTEPLIEMTQRLNLFQQSTVSAGRVFQWLDEDTETDHGNAKLKLQPGLLAFEQVNFTYDQETNVLNNVSFQVPVGGFVGIVGHSGSGKSTLANLVMRFYQPSAGAITFAENNLNVYPQKEIRRQFAMVQQDSFLFRSSIADNIDMGRSLGEQRIHWAAEMAGIDGFIQSLPNKYHTNLAERGANLSSGQRQLISLARALAGKPSLLVLDEATANVDSASERKVQQAIRKLKGEMTIIAIAHRLSTITQADQILVMHQGDIVQRGSHAALLAEQGLYQSLYQLQFQAAGLFDEAAQV
ncbi:MAG: ATP-binding cassette domain-containing protein [Gammaproteobacteria bacterium]|nr:ATP-binding cassette domain-containing protein [Gammaproteobacteria bacterium]